MNRIRHPGWTFVSVGPFSRQEGGKKAFFWVMDSEGSVYHGGEASRVEHLMPRWAAERVLVAFTIFLIQNSSL